MTALTRRIEDLEASVTQLRQREQQLMVEIKKRGDLARQLCSSKDEEIRQLREKLHYDQKHPSSTSPSSKAIRKSSSIATPATEVSIDATTPQRRDDSAQRENGDITKTPQAMHSNSVDDREKEQKVESRDDTHTSGEGGGLTEVNLFQELKLDDGTEEEVLAVTLLCYLS